VVALHLEISAVIGWRIFQEELTSLLIGGEEEAHGTETIELLKSFMQTGIVTIEKR
tara:strand:- start:787 stop:954 length:168 start_codon:yes stop_codon:yes gene_type:complete